MTQYWLIKILAVKFVLMEGGKRNTETDGTQIPNNKLQKMASGKW
jgi:hypothetical protein